MISVIIPAYNAESFIERTIRSVLGQTYQNFEIVVVNDGSTDQTKAIVQKLMKVDKRIRLINQENQGVARTRNNGIRQSRGEFIAPLDADDIWYPEFLELLLKTMLENKPSVGVVYCWSIYIDTNDNYLPQCQTSTIEGNVYLPMLNMFLLGNASSALVRRTCMEKLNGYSPELLDNNAQGSEDWDFFIRASRYYEFKVVKKILVGYRQVLGGMSFNYDRMWNSCNYLLNRAKKASPEIPEKVYNWSKSAFSWYLVTRCHQVNNHRLVLRYLMQCISLDYIHLFRLRFYTFLWTHSTQLIKQWLMLNPDVRPFPLPVLPHQSSSIADLERIEALRDKDNQKFPRKQFERFLEWRWNNIQRHLSRSR